MSAPFSRSLFFISGFLGLRFPVLRHKATGPGASAFQERSRLWWGFFPAACSPALFLIPYLLIFPVPHSYPLPPNFPSPHSLFHIS